MKYKHIIWDWNGTLVDDAWLCVEIMNSILNKRGYKLIDINEYRKYFTFPVKEYYIKLGFNFEIEPFEISGMEFIKIFQKRKFDASLYPNTINMLNILKQKGVTHSILSAQNQHLLTETVQYYALEKYFINISGLDDNYAYEKISKGIELLKKIKFNLDEILIIGDTVHDFEVAQALGVDSILLSSGHNSKIRLKKTGVKVFNVLEDILDYLISFESKYGMKF